MFGCVQCEALSTLAPARIDAIKAVINPSRLDGGNHDYRNSIFFLGNFCSFLNFLGPFLWKRMMRGARLQAPLTDYQIRVNAANYIKDRLSKHTTHLHNSLSGGRYHPLYRPPPTTITEKSTKDQTFDWLSADTLSFAYLAACVSVGFYWLWMVVFFVSYYCCWFCSSLLSARVCGRVKLGACNGPGERAVSFAYDGRNHPPIAKHRRVICIFFTCHTCRPGARWRRPEAPISAARLERCEHVINQPMHHLVGGRRRRRPTYRWPTATHIRLLLTVVDWPTTSNYVMRPVKVGQSSSPISRPKN